MLTSLAIRASIPLYSRLEGALAVAGAIKGDVIGFALAIDCRFGVWRRDRPGEYVEEDSGVGGPLV